MPAIKLEQFGGMFPAWDGHLLPIGQATNAENGFLFSGTLVGWRKPKLLRALNNSAARMAYRVPTVTEAQARALLVFKTQPNDGDTAIVGEITYTFRTVLAESTVTGAGGEDEVRIGLPFEVLIGGDTNATATNFKNALTADNGENTNSGVTYGENTPLNGSVKYYIPDTAELPGILGPTVGTDLIDGADYWFVIVGAEDVGASYNLVKVAESTTDARLTWLYDVATLTHTTVTYRGGINPTFDTSITGTAAWLEFEDADTNVIKSPVVDDQFNRFYFASPTQMPRYTTYDRIQSADSSWLLGVPPPGCAPTASVVGGGNDLQLGHFTASILDVFITKANRIYLIPITPGGATQIKDVTAVGDADRFPDAAYPDAHWAAVLYSDFNDKPDILLNTGEIVAGLHADELNVSAFLNPTNLSANTKYWIGFAIDSPIDAFRCGGTGDTIQDMVSWPNTFTNGPNVRAPTTALPHSQITSDGVQPDDGDVMTIGVSTYTFQTVLAGGTISNVHVKIGASVAATLNNLFHAINASGGTPGTDYNATAGANARCTAASPVSGAIVLTQISASQGDGSNIQTLFVPAVNAHLEFPDVCFQAGYTENMLSMNMYANCLSDDVIESRSYVYTWVSEYGEEGPPSPPVLLDGWSNGSWTIGLWSPPPDDQGVLRNLKKLNIYRTVPGTAGETVFFFVKQLDLGTVDYLDETPNNLIAFNDQLQSTNWFPPPENLQGFTVMQNGMIAGFVGNEIWFCEPYHPHAWPPGYVTTVDYPIIGLGITNGALVVCTSAHPYVLSGSAPSSMSQTRCADANPCSSRGSILSGDGAVTFISPNGLIQITAGAVATNTTDLWITRQKWQQLVPQHDVRAVLLSSCYYALGSVSIDGTDTSVAQDGFTIELAQDNTSFTIWPQPGGHRLGVQLLNSPVEATDIQNIYTDPWTGIGVVIADGSVYYFDFSDAAPELKSYTWRSKLYQQNAKRNYSCMKVFFTVPPGTPTQNETRLEEDADHADWVTLPEDRYGYIKTYVDLDDNGVLSLIDCREIRKSGEILRIVDGFKCDTWVWEILGRVEISNVQIASTIKELAQV